MLSIAVMGDYDSIYGFLTLGMEIFPTGEDPEEAARTLRTLAEGSYGIIYMTERLAAMLEKEIARYADRVLPAIILIPGTSGNTGKGIESVRKSVEQAVGSDILFS